VTKYDTLLSSFAFDVNMHHYASGAVDFPVPPFASLIKNYEEFDDVVFGLSTAEALWMDPQQRLILEVRIPAKKTSPCNMPDILSAWSCHTIT